MIKLELWEVTPRNPTGELKFFHKEKSYTIHYYNRDPYAKGFGNGFGTLLKAESTPSYLIKNKDAWYYGTYVEIKRKLFGVKDG